MYIGTDHNKQSSSHHSDVVHMSTEEMTCYSEGTYINTYTHVHPLYALFLYHIMYMHCVVCLNNSNCVVCMHVHITTCL